MSPETRKAYYKLVAKHNGEPKEVSEYAAALLGSLHEVDRLNEIILDIQAENAKLATALAAHENHGQQ